MKVDKFFVKSDNIIDILLSKKRTNLQVPTNKAIDGFSLIFCQFGHRNHCSDFNKIMCTSSICRHDN